MQRQNVAKLSDLCTSSWFLNSVDSITQNRYLRLSKKDCELSDASMKGSGALFVALGAVDGTWKDLQTNRISWRLNGLPNLSENPPEKIVPPDDVYDVTARLHSKANRIVPVTKSRDLVRLRNEVYRTRSVKLHWNLGCIVEKRREIREELTMTDEDASLDPKQAQTGISKTSKTTN